MLIPPAGLPVTAVTAALGRGWGLTATAVAYRALGFGSHHWAVMDTAGDQWFVSGDDLAARRDRAGEPLTEVFDRLRAALAVARDLRDHGRTCVVAPVPGRAGELLLRVGDQFSLALYPHVSGQSFAWGEFPDAAHRRAVLDMIIAVHTAPPVTRRYARADDFALARRADLDAVLCGDGPGEDGPDARAAARLVADHATVLRRRLARYDELAQLARDRPGPMVLTHGEPHPGNTMLTVGGWRLIDWDTVLVAPPERDLWRLDPGDGSLLADYTAATGMPPVPERLELYRRRWDLTDIALGVSRFRGLHPGSAGDDQDWEILRDLVSRPDGPAG